MSITANQQFEGPTIEEALESAVSILGDDLEILDAQKVRRRRLLGLRRQELFEVTAARKGTVEPKDFGDVLQRMVDRVDEAERSMGSDLRDTDRKWWSEAEFVVPQAEPAHAAREVGVDVRVEPARVLETLERPAPMHAAPVVLTEKDPVWSAAALLELGLPPALVGRLNPDSLHGDLDWVAALASGIGELLDTAQAMSGPCELTGHGAASAVHLLRGACDGFRLDSLIIDGRRVAATPLELSLAIRTLLGRPQTEADT